MKFDFSDLKKLAESNEESALLFAQQQAAMLHARGYCSTDAFEELNDQCEHQLNLLALERLPA